MEDHFRDKNLNEKCAGCKYCNFQACNVNNSDDVYHGYDGGSICEKHDINLPESDNNRFIISAHWKKCSNFEKADKYDNIEEMCIHIVYALSDFPKYTTGETKQEVFDNVMENYQETISLYPPVKEIIFDEIFFDYLVKIYKSECNPGEGKEINKKIVKKFIDTFYKATGP